MKLGVTSLSVTKAGRKENVLQLVVEVMALLYSILLAGHFPLVCINTLVLTLNQPLHGTALVRDLQVMLEVVSIH